MVGVSLEFGVALLYIHREIQSVIRQQDHRPTSNRLPRTLEQTETFGAEPLVRLRNDPHNQADWFHVSSRSCLDAGKAVCTSFEITIEALPIS